MCSDYRKTSHFQCVSDSLCDRDVNDHEPAKCNGIIRDCQDIDDNDVNICETVNDMRIHMLDKQHQNDEYIFERGKKQMEKFMSVFCICRVNQIDDIIISNIAMVEWLVMLELCATVD